MDTKERILARSSFSLKIITAGLFFGWALFMVPRFPGWLQWLFLISSIVFTFWFLACDVIITSSTLRRRYPFRLVFREGLCLYASTIKKMTCYYAPTTVHSVVVEAVVEGKKHKLEIEVTSYDVRCQVFDFAIRHGIPLICRNESDRNLVDQIRAGKCHLDPATGYWNIVGIN